MDSSVQSSHIPSNVRSLFKHHVHAWDGGGFSTPAFSGVGDDLGDASSLRVAAGALGCSMLGCSQGLGRAAQVAASFREEIWTLDGVHRDVICKGTGRPYFLQQG